MGKESKMRIERIAAEKDELRFMLDAPVARQRIRLSAYLPALGEEAEVYTAGMSVEGDSFSIPRRLGGEDGLTLFYAVADENGEVPGVKYASPAYSARTHAALTPSSRKGLSVEDGMAEHALSLGVRQAVLSVNLGDFLMPYPRGGDTLFYRYGGRDWYIRADAVNALEETLLPLTRAGVLVTLTLLNAPAWRWETEPSFWEELRHPEYDGTGEVSMFDMVRAAGCRAFAAFVSFLAGRYMRADAPHGRIDGMAVGCSVNLSGEWARCGTPGAEELARQYTAALRLAYQCAASVWENARVYAALNGARGETCRDYPARELLAGIARQCAGEGDFPWGVMYQAETEELTSESPGALRGVLSAPGMRYGEQPRRLLLSVQGFPSDGTMAGEARQAEAYRRAYRIAAGMPEIDGFVYDTHVDHEEEGALLGLLRRAADGSCSEKPAANVFRSLS